MKTTKLTGTDISYYDFLTNSEYGMGLKNVPETADSSSEQLITDIEAKMDSHNSFSQQTIRGSLTKPWLSCGCGIGLVSYGKIGRLPSRQLPRTPLVEKGVRDEKNPLCSRLSYRLFGFC